MRWFYNLKINTKIQLSFWIVSFFIVSSFGYGYYHNSVEQQVKTIDTRLKMAADYLPNIVNDQYVEAVINKNQDPSLNQLARDIALKTTEFNDSVSLAYMYVMFVDNTGNVFYVTSSLNESELKDNSVTYKLTPYDEPNTVNTLKRVQSTGVPEFLEYDSKVGQFRTLYTPVKTSSGKSYIIAVDEKLEEVQAIKDETLTFISIVGIISLVVAGLVSWFIGVIISKPIVEMVKTFEQLSSGNADLTYTIPVKYEDETGKMARNFNLFITMLRDMIDKVKQDTGSLSDGLTDINTMMGNLLDDSHKQSERATTSAATIEEITATMSNISDSTVQTQKSVENVGELTNNSSQSIKKLSDEIGGITVSAKELGSVIQNLENKSQDIAKIINVIKGIADQTNLLALNASIEAARAGEHGRGFAVVAEEVRNLAAKTTEATVNISNTISDISTEVKKATGKMTETNANVASGVSLAEQVLHEINSITDNMQVVLENIQVINLATREQSVATQDLAKASEEMSHSSILSKEVVEKTDETVASLQQKASNLKMLAHQFNT